MTLRKRRGQFYGDGHADIEAFLRDYTADTYRAAHFANARCEKCKGTAFKVRIDDTEGAAVRSCVKCRRDHPIADSADYLAGADLDDCECPCGGESFELTVGAALHAASEAVRWLYFGLRCTACGLIGNYGDYKCELDDYRELLTTV